MNENQREKIHLKLRICDELKNCTLTFFFGENENLCRRGENEKNIIIFFLFFTLFSCLFRRQTERKRISRRFFKGKMPFLFSCLFVVFLLQTRCMFLCFHLWFVFVENEFNRILLLIWDFALFWLNFFYILASLNFWLSLSSLSVDVTFD